MPQPKGHTGNPYGRPKGTPNRTTATIRSWMVSLINRNREQIEQDLQSLEPKERLYTLTKLLPYLLPKVDNEMSVEGACYGREAVQDDAEGWGCLNKPVIKRWYEQPEPEQ